MRFVKHRSRPPGPVSRLNHLLKHMVHPAISWSDGFQGNLSSLEETMFCQGTHPQMEVVQPLLGGPQQKQPIRVHVVFSF